MTSTPIRIRDTKWRATTSTFYEGNAVETGVDSFESKAYVTVFNYSGKIVVPRTEVAAVADKAGTCRRGTYDHGLC